ncbi:hypothetical protein BV20DRAFT_670626 [Pilatotrama ljubarskyi]|nr:hypothetical protein BV20DRAFT_670626 [Pilatotrama ljubarskyi]
MPESGKKSKGTLERPSPAFCMLFCARIRSLRCYRPQLTRFTHQAPSSRAWSHCDIVVRDALGLPYAEGCWSRSERGTSSRGRTDRFKGVKCVRGIVSVRLQGRVMYRLGIKRRGHSTSEREVSRAKSARCSRRGRRRATIYNRCRAAERPVARSLRLHVNMIWQRTREHVLAL